MKNFLFILLSFLFLISCSVQKRKYQKGFYVSSSKLKTQKDKSVTTKKNKETRFLVNFKK